ncbi:leucine-rich repeat-containing protein 14-like [Antechinus flavipes]|uniref:leucine-rich repeat-containing protein 14-like n=1 Tax=Antechinus flavipes TaxID=38775 RepID=UPI0022369E5D|nr:leucine-rich repeat-containing protein 14-like [Antechinus flavipes]
MAHTKYFSSFVSDHLLVQDEEKICKILKCMPQNMFEILFKVAFRNNKTKLMYELVKIWPYSQLKFQKLLQTCPFNSGTSSKRHAQYQWPLTYNESNKGIIDAIVLGVLGYIRKVIICDAQQIPYRRLQQLDMTGLLGKDYFWNLKLMRLWATSIARAKIYSKSLEKKTHYSESQARNQVAEGFPVTTFPVEAHVELLVDFQICSSSEEFLKEALLDNTYSPLHLTCQDFYTSHSLVHGDLEILALLDPLVLRRVDLSHSILISMDIRHLMLQITTFQNLQSLKLPHFNEDMQSGKHPMLKTNIDILAAELPKLNHLREISLHSICLSDQVEYLLRGLQCSLESLQLSYCSLTNNDLIYLSQSHHSPQLIKLDLEGNNITEQQDSFLQLLKSVSNSLRWLNVTKCGISVTDFCEILPYLYSCSRLSHLGLSRNPLISFSVCYFIGLCQHKLPNLKLISVSIFLDCCRNLPKHGPLPQLLEDYLDNNKFLSVMREMEHTQKTRGDSAIEFTTSLSFDRGDYFDLR